MKLFKKLYSILVVTGWLAIGITGTADSAPAWSSFQFDIISANSFGCGVYRWDHNANGKGVYGNSNSFSLAWYDTPATNNSSAGWWLLGDAGGPYEYHGSGLFPDNLDNQEISVTALPSGNDAASREPVNLINGGMFFDESDCRVAGAGFGLHWSRSYNSALNTTNGLGYRWSHSFDWSITPSTNVYILGHFTNATPSLILMMGGGEARTLLQDDGTNIWRGVHAPPLTIIQTTHGEYFMNLPSGYSCLFGTNKFIKSISNTWGQALGFSYTNCSGTVLLGKVSHSDGRALSFSYSGNRLSRVETPSTNLCYLYYYNALGELTGAVTRSSSGDFLSSYAYDTNSVHAMLQHQNPLGEVATYSYLTNAEGQLTPKCIKVAVETNYYEHTIAYLSGKTIVTYLKGNTNTVYQYYYDTNPSSLLITKIDGPNDSNTVRLVNYDPELQTVIEDKIGIYEGSTNIHWNKMSFDVSFINGSASGKYSYYTTYNNSGIYTNGNGIGYQLGWNFSYNCWDIHSQGTHYIASGAAWPQDTVNWVWTYNSTPTTINATRTYDPIVDQTLFGASISASSQYDPNGRMVSYSPNGTDPWTFTWDANLDTMASATDPEGHKAEWEYTNGAVSVERLYPATNQPVEIHYAYSSKGVLSAVTNANGHWVSYESDSYGYPTQTVSQAGVTNRLTWDVLGHLKEIRLPGHTTDTNDPPNMIPRIISFDPNELGWVRKITYPDNTSETFAYNAIGDLTNYIDVAGRTNIFNWLPTKKLASITRYLGSGGSNQAVTIGVAYDQQMNVLNIKDELGRAVESYQLDLQDRPVSVTNIESQVMKITWGLKDKVNQIVRFDGTTNIITYDGNSRVSRVSYAGEAIDLAYFRNNLLMTASNSLGTVSNVYDGANRLVSSWSSGLLPQPSTICYGYYPAGQVSNVVSVAGTNSYVLDAHDRIAVQNIIAPNGRQDSIGYVYDPVNGQLAQVAYSNGITCTYGYDILDRLTGMTWRNVSNQVVRSRSYSYTAAGMISRMNTEDGGYVDYSYDSLDRLTRETCVDVYGQITADTKYEFDLAGNRTKKTILDSTGNPFITVGYTLGITNRLASKSVAETNLAVRTDVGGYASETIGTNDRFGVLWISNAVSGGMVVKPEVLGTNFWAYGFTVGLGTQKIVAAIRDMAGNVTQATNSPILSVITNSAVQYNSAGCVTNITGTGPGYTKTVGLTWNSQYQVTTVTTNGGLAGSYKYDALGRRSWAIENGSTNWFVYDGVHVVADLDSAGGIVRSYVWGPGVDNMLSMTVYGASTNTYYALKDHLGSVLALTDGSGNIAESYRYDAWGRITVYDANGIALKSSAIGNRYCWQGREYCFQTGLYYFRARWYEPVTGRWLSNDPIGISGGLNQYVFCGNNPVNFRDPFGLCVDGSEYLNGYLNEFNRLWRDRSPYLNVRGMFNWSINGDQYAIPFRGGWDLGRQHGRPYYANGRFFDAGSSFGNYVAAYALIDAYGRVNAEIGLTAVNFAGFFQTWSEEGFREAINANRARAYWQRQAFNDHGVRSVTENLPGSRQTELWQGR